MLRGFTTLLKDSLFVRGVGLPSDLMVSDTGGYLLSDDQVILKYNVDIRCNKSFLCYILVLCNTASLTLLFLYNTEIHKTKNVNFIYIVKVKIDFNMTQVSV